VTFRSNSLKSSARLDFGHAGPSIRACCALNSDRKLGESYYSITSSPRASSDVGMSKPSTFAVLR
jgi:hypothetical protein